MHFAAVREAKESVSYLGCPDPVFTALAWAGKHHQCWLKLANSSKAVSQNDSSPL